MNKNGAFFGHQNAPVMGLVGSKSFPSPKGLGPDNGAHTLRTSRSSMQTVPTQPMAQVPYHPSGIKQVGHRGKPATAPAPSGMYGRMVQKLHK